MSTDSTKDFTAYERLVDDYHKSVARCLASADQLRAAQRDLAEIAQALGGDGFQETDGQPQVLKPAADTKLGSQIANLSDREFEVFALIGGGLSSREIAERLHLALSTVETYRERLKGKLEMSSGPALTRAATVWALSQRRSDPADGT